MSDGAISEQKRPAFHWMDVLWLVLLAVLAVLPPVAEIHKQLTLLAIAVVQLRESWFLRKFPRRGAAYIVLLKIALATLLIDHTGELSINSGLARPFRSILPLGLPRPFGWLRSLRRLLSRFSRQGGEFDSLFA